MDITTRQEAKALGATHYFTGKPCKHGHIAKRYTKTKICADCGYEHRRRQQLANPEDNRRRSKAWRDANKDRANNRAKSWHAAHPDRVRAIKKAWQDRNPDYVRANTANGRARRKNASGVHSADEIASIFALQRGRCANPICRASIKRGYHRDHIIPLVLGGDNTIRNIQLLCRPCNLSKGAKHPIEWARGIGMLI